MEDGRFREDLPFFGGKAILREKLNKKNKNNPWEGDANTAVMAKLAEVGGLFARGVIKHSYPHSWRSKAPIVFRNTPQWFAAVDRPVGDGQDDYGTTIRERALRSIDELVKWTPQKGRNRLYSMIEARPDWVLSRQRAWGVPLTCFVKKGAMPTDDDFLLRNEAVNARVLARGIRMVRRRGSLGMMWIMMLTNRCSISWTFGLTVDRPMRLFCVTARMGPMMALLICILKARTSTAAGSIRRCCRLVAPRVPSCRKLWSSNMARIFCVFGWRKLIIPMTSGSGRKS